MVMGGVVVESSRIATHSEEIFGDNNKKKKRRSRKSKQNYTLSACSSLSEICTDESSLLGKQSPSSHIMSNEHKQLQTECDTGFSSRPTMHVNDQTADNIQDHQPHTRNDVVFSNSSPEPVVCEEPVEYSVMPRPVNSEARPKYFPSHWSSESVDEALEKGQLLRAVFHVNAYNTFEAYCKIDGVQSDALINGVIAQNRAMEGDTVAIIIDHPSLWPRMKGTIDPVNNSTCHDSSNEKNKLNSEDKVVSSSIHSGFLDNSTLSEIGSPGAKSCNSYVNGVSDNDYIHSYQTSASDPAMACCSSDAYNSVISVKELCTLVSLHPSKRPTGRVVAIIERSLKRDKIVGFLSVKQWIYSRKSRRKECGKNKQYSDNNGYILLTPTNSKFTKMMVPVRNLPRSIKKRLESSDLTVETDIVGAEIVQWYEESKFPEARVIRTFGRGIDLESHIAAILFEYAIDVSEFPSNVLSCLPNMPWEIPHEEFKSRRDLRNLCIFTIDPKTASDLDDALSVERMKNGVFRVGVHIADVSYFVHPDIPIDFDAQIRSTSVYLLQRKLPMLPPMLSDNLASLNPGEDRLAFSIFWDINSSGEVLDRWIGRTIIHSCCKFSYEHAQEIIDGTFKPDSMGPSLYGPFEWCDVIKSVKSLHEISIVLKENRFKDGALSLESSKVVFLFDEEEIPYDSALSGRSNSNFLVEEFMLLANRTAAEVITRAYPSCALLRKHPKPDPRKLKDFEAFCNKYGLKLDISSSTQIHQSLENIRGELAKDSILFDILMSYAARPMQLATYFCSGDSKDTNNDRCHYALAVSLYTHFTSPLRRYPDIVVHRTLAAAMEAENIYSNSQRIFTGLFFDEDAIESVKAQDALSVSASKHRVLCTETLADVAAHCNEKKLATRHVRDAMDKLCMWAVLKKKEILYTEARVLGLGPKFMSIYIPKLAVERRIYYNEVENLKVEWLESTSTLVLSQSMNKKSSRRNSPGKSRTLEEIALIVSPTDLNLEMDPSDSNNVIHEEPSVFPLTVHLLSTIPVVLHAVGGDDGPPDIMARLYLSSYSQ